MSGLELLLEYLTKYFPILLFIFIALAFGIVTLLLSYLVQPKYPEPEKLSAYECGSEPFSDARMSSAVMRPKKSCKAAMQPVQPV